VIKKTEYVLVALTPKNSVLFTQPFESKKLAIANYNNLCEENPLAKYQIIKRQTVEELIAESEDYRQQRFEFVK
jgi:hypothetical protein